MLIVILLLFFCTYAHAENIIADINIGGTVFKDMIVSKDFLLVEPITIGVCKSNDLKDFGVPELSEDEIIIKTVKQECLENKSIDLAYSTTFTPVRSDSVFLNFAAQAGKTNALHISPGLFLFDTLFYSSFSYQKTDKYTFKRNYSFIERDIDSITSVIKAGDIYSNTNSFLVQLPKKKMGVLFQRKWALNPLTKPYNTLSKQITLTSKSTIEIIQNNNIVYRTELLPGVYNLSSLPTQGLVGTYTIRITDAFGRVSEQTETYIASAEMLRKGIIDYSISLPFAGFLRYGLTDYLTAGFHATTKEQSLSLDYLSVIGQSSLEFSTKNNFRLAHLYQKERLSLSTSLIRTDSTTKEDKITTVAAVGSYATDDFGTFTVKAEKTTGKNGTAGVGYTKSFRNLNLYSNISTSKELSFGVGYNTRVQRLPLNLGISVSHSKKENKLYAYLNIPIGSESKAWGLNSRYSKTNNTNAVETDLYYRNLFDFIGKAKVGSSNDYSLTTIGSIGCVNRNVFKCGIGGPVYPSEGFVIANGDVKIDGRERQGLNTIQAYRDTLVSSTSDLIETEVKIATRSGQGVLIQKPVLITGKVKSKSKSILIDGEEVYLTEDGEFSYVTANRKLEVIIDGGKVVKNIDTDSEVINLNIEEAYDISRVFKIFDTYVGTNSTLDCRCSSCDD